MKTEKPDPRKVKNFPLNNSLAKIVCERGKFYVCERKHYWDSTAKKSTEERIYIGRIVDGVYYSTPWQTTAACSSATAVCEL